MSGLKKRNVAPPAGNEPKSEESKEPADEGIWRECPRCHGAGKLVNSVGIRIAEGIGAVLIFICIPLGLLTLFALVAALVGGTE